MNAALKAKHMEELKNEVAKMMYDRLCSDKGEALSDHDQELVFEIVCLEERKQELTAELTGICKKSSALLAKLNA